MHGRLDARQELPDRPPAARSPEHLIHDLPPLRAVQQYGAMTGPARRMHPQDLMVVRLVLARVSGRPYYVRDDMGVSAPTRRHRQMVMARAERQADHEQDD